MKKAILIVVAILVTACLGKPEGVKPISGFDLNRYLGKWYEIARLDHRFERGLSHISAQYSLREDGGVKVENRGYSMEKNKWKDAVGKAYFVEDQKTGYLKVSFFGPFYGSYIIIELDQKDYQYALVSGPDQDYLWVLSRTPKMEPAILKRLVAKAKSLGFDTEKLIYVEQGSLATTD